MAIDGRTPGLKANQVEDIIRLNTFLKQFPAWAHSLIESMAVGQDGVEDVYQEAKEIFGVDPTKGQHPHYACMTGAGPYGHESHFCPSYLGGALVNRTESAIILDAEGKVLPEIKSFVALAQSKGIKHVFHTKSGSSWLIRKAYDYWSLPENERETLVIHPVLKEYIENRKELYDTVQGHGLSFYERMGLLFFSGSEADKYVLAMASQQIMWDNKQLKQEIKGSEFVPILQDVSGLRHYFWNARNRHFVQVPCLDHNFDRAKPKQVGISRHLKFYLNQLPFEKGNLQSKKEWDHIGLVAVNGFTEFLNMALDWATKPNLAKEMMYVSACADSRNKLKAITGPLKERFQRSGLRVVGGFATKADGTLTDETVLSILHAEELNADMLFTHHSNCGAMAAIHKHCTDPNGAGANLPQAFKDLGDYRQGLSAAVLSKGARPDEIINRYNAVVGMPSSTVEDCYSVQQFMTDSRAIRKAFPNNKIMFGFIDMVGSQLYINPQGSNKLLPIPGMDEAVVVAKQQAAENMVGPKLPPCLSAQRRVTSFVQRFER